jgi:hypothetical protein
MNKVPDLEESGERASRHDLEFLLRAADRDCARGSSLNSHLVAAWLIRAMCNEILAARDTTSAR